MKIEIVERILQQHSVPYQKNGNRILADSMESGTKLWENMVDMTNWNKRQLYNWLGY